MMKIIFFGSTELSAVCLEEILKYSDDFQVCLIICQPDNLKVKKNAVYGPVKNLAIKHNISYVQPKKIIDVFNEIKKNNVKLGICVAYGQIIPQQIIDLFPLGIINVHPSLLPKYRGAAPIQHVIWNAEKYTGITIMKIVKKMDAGPYCFQNKFLVNPNMTTGELMNLVKQYSPKILIKCINDIKNNTVRWFEQDHKQVSYAPALTRSQERILWNQDAQKIVNQIKAFSPIPGTYSMFKNGTIKFFNAILGNHNFTSEFGTINIIEKNYICIQANKSNNCVHVFDILLPGKKRIMVKDYHGKWPFNVSEKLY